MLLVVVLMSAMPAAAQTQDTSGNRLAAAYRYVKVAGIPKLMDNMVQQMALNVPPSVREQFIQYMSMDDVEMQRFETIMISALVQHFTAAELVNLTEYLESPLGKSTMEKMPAYMATAMPSIQSMMAEKARKFSKSGQVRGAK